VLLCSLAQCGAEWGALQEEVSGTLLLPYLGNHPNAAVVLRRLWAANRKAVLLGMVELHAKEPSCVVRGAPPLPRQTKRCFDQSSRFGLLAQWNPLSPAHPAELHGGVSAPRIVHPH
jgi:hypothetical protein